MAWRAMDPLSAISDDSASEEGSEDEEEEDDEHRVGAKRSGEAGDGGDAVKSQKTASKDSKGGAQRTVEAKVKKDAKKGDVSYNALSRHGYSGGPSILHVPVPKQTITDSDWAWSNGKRKNDEEQEESLEDRERTRQMANQGAVKMATEALAESAYAKKQKRDAAAEQRALSFSQKEKRKRDLGQASRGKNYVEEEKRLLRDSGVYSGFDT